MVNASELRIGNYVQAIGPGLPLIIFDQRDRVIRLTGLGIANIQDHKFYRDKIDPINLSEEWLGKLGFTKGRTVIGGYYGYSNGIVEVDNNYQIILFDGRMEEPGTKEFYPKLEYIHQLQNLYYALIGEELTIKTD